MSKVGEKSASETLSQLKEVYQQRETDLETRHKDQLRDVNESHQVEIARIRKENQEKLKAVQEEASTKLNQKDLQFQKEIEALRSMNAKKIMSEARHPKKSSSSDES